MKTIIITGATSGIGLETARSLTDLGYFVIGIGHSQTNCDQAKASIISKCSTAKITYFVADLMQQNEVLKIAKELSAYLSSNCDNELYALINNVGCVRSWYTTTNEGYEQQFALNHLAGFLLTHELLPYLKKANGRVIMTGSESHKGIKVHWDDIMLQRGYNPLIAYKQSKLCNILFAKGLNDRYASLGIHAYVVDPGLVNTDIGNKKTGSLVNIIWSFRKRHGVSPTIPAKTYVYLCEQNEPPKNLYYHLCLANTYSKQVTSENANQLFMISERLCKISFDKEALA